MFFFVEINGDTNIIQDGKIYVWDVNNGNKMRQLKNVKNYTQTERASERQIAVSISLLLKFITCKQS